jgi:hypothetical protein
VPPFFVYTSFGVSVYSLEEGKIPEYFCKRNRGENKYNCLKDVVHPFEWKEKQKQSFEMTERLFSHFICSSVFEIALLIFP